jgi:hypothetical protein
VENVWRLDHDSGSNEASGPIDLKAASSARLESGLRLSRRKRWRVTWIDGIVEQEGSRSAIYEWYKGNFYMKNEECQIRLTAVASYASTVFNNSKDVRPKP